MNEHQHLIAESFTSNKEMVAIFDEDMVGQQRLLTLKWIRYLIEKPKQAGKEEERVRAQCIDHSFIEDILKGDAEFRMNYFNGLVEQLLNEFSSKSIKKGNLIVRSLTLKIWKERKVQLDEDKKQFLVISKDKIKNLDLSTYAIKWLGQKKEYQSFSLDSVSSINRYKQLLFGWTNFDSARIWHDAIIKVISTTSLTKEGLLQNRIDISQSAVITTYTAPTLNDIYPIIRKSSLQQLARPEEEELEKAEKPAKNLIFGNIKVSQNIPNPGYATQLSETDSSQDGGNSAAKDNRNLSPTQLLQQKSSPFSLAPSSQASKIKPIKMSSSSNLESNTQSKPDESIKPSIIAQQQLKQLDLKSSEKPILLVQEQKSIDSLSSSNQNGVVQISAQVSSSFSRVENKSTESEEEVPTPPLIQDFLEGFKLTTLELENKFNTITFKGGMRFLQSADDPRRFKLILVLQGQNAFEVFNCICNIDDYSKWNNNVAETKVLNVMRNERTAIIYQKHKAVGIMYRPRDFVYLRHSFIQNETYYIIDKSIEYESLPHSMSVIRGEIEHIVWSFKDHQKEENRCLMIGDFFINNQGYSNKEQDASITFAYLKNFANLSGFISQKNFQRSIIANMFDVNQIEQLKKSPLNQEKGKQDRHFQEKGSDKKQAELKPNKDNLFEKQESEQKNQRNEEIDSHNSFEAKEEEEEDIYEKEEIQNSTLNLELNKFSLEEQQKSQSSESPSLPTHEVLSKKSGDKLAGLTIPQIVDLVNKNKFWSFCLDQNYSMGCISTEEKRLASDPITGNYQFKKDWERDPKTGKFIFLNKEKIAAQKKVISFILSKIGSNIISGKSIMNISLPIDIFEPRSNIERFAYGCSFAPVFLKRASYETDPVEQMKNTAIYLITTTIMYLNLEKPFNPILGETYQGRLDGFPIYCEQISHHPPICAYQYYTDTYVLNGQLESTAQMHANSVTGLNQGNVTVTFFKTKNSIGTIQAPGSLNGTAFGVRYMSVEGRYIAYDLTNKLVFEVRINPDKKGIFKSSTQPIDYIAGGIYRVTDKFIEKFNNLKPAYYKFTGLNMKEDIVEQVSVINGIWNKEIFIDEKKWFDLESPLPYLLEGEINPLPSDSSFRQDILYLKDGNKVLSQEFKEKLEVFQRNDKKLREKAFETAKKLKKLQVKK